MLPCFQWDLFFGKVRVITPLQEKTIGWCKNPVVNHQKIALMAMPVCGPATDQLEEKGW
jgi:hypothetical protein